MTKKDIAALLSPGICFLFILVSAYLTCELIRHKAHADPNQQKFDAFLSDVQSGKIQPAQAKWVEIVRRERAAGDGLLLAISGAGDAMQQFVLVSFIGLALQVGTAFSVRKKFSKP